MHARHPMHASRSMSTMPSGRLSSAVTGQIVTHGAFVQWLQRSTVKWRFTAGKVPFSVYFTQVRKLPSGTSFSDLQATVQAWQPMQRRWSIKNPNCIGALYGPSSTEAPLLRERAAAKVNVARRSM